MSLDASTLNDMEALARKWGSSKSDVIGRAMRNFKRQADAEDNKPSALEALDWLQQGGGLKPNEAEAFRAAVMEQRAARKFWWES